MDVFLSMGWDKTGDETSSFFFRDIFNKYSAAYHQMYGLNQSPWPCEKSTASAVEWDPTTLKRQAVDGALQHSKVLQITPPVGFPRKSVLNTKSQIDYLFAIIRLLKSNAAGLPPDPDSVAVIEESQIKLMQESCDFQNFAKMVMLQSPSSYNVLAPGIAKYVAEAWKAQLQVVHIYPRNYQLNGGVTLIPKEVVKTIELVPEKVILQLGRIPAQGFMDINSTERIPRDFKFVNDSFPAKTIEFKPVSFDANAVTIAQKYDVDIIISPNTMKSLAGNVGPLFKRAWEIPFTIREEQVGDVIKKRIFIDDPLPPKEMSAMEKNSFFNTLAVKTTFSDFGRMFTLPDTVRLEKMNRKQPLCKSKKMADDVCDKVDKCASETEITEEAKSASETEVIEEALSNHDDPDSDPKKSPPTKSMSGAEDSATDSDCSLVIDLGDSDSTPSQKPKKPKKPKKSKIPEIPKSENTVNLLNTILQDQKKLMQSTQRKELSTVNDVPEDPTEYISPKFDENVTYRTHCFRANQRSLRLLVRSSIDTVTLPKVQSFMIESKSEYQPWYGSECSTPRELQEQWMDIHLRPKCKIFTVRLDAYTGDFIMMDQKNASALAADTALRSGESTFTWHCLQNTWAVLSTLYDRDLPKGSYLLQHGLHDGINVQVMSSTPQPESSSYDLVKEYAIDTNVTVVREIGECWIALDPWTVTPLQRAVKRPPLTFEASDSDEQIRTRSKRNASTQSPLTNNKNNKKSKMTAKNKKQQKKNLTNSK